MNSLVPSALIASENSLLLPSTSKFSRGHAGSNPKKINNNAIISTPRFENIRLISASKQLNGGKEKEYTEKVTWVIILDEIKARSYSPFAFLDVSFILLAFLRNISRAESFARTRPKTSKPGNCPWTK